jgi:hypothetical protein
VAGQSQAGFGEAQARLGARQAELGGQQAEFGRKQAKASAVADEQLRKMIEQAIKDGRARKIE